MPWVRILIGSFSVCTLFLILDLLGPGKKKYTFPMYVSSLVVTILFNTWLIWGSTPALNGPFWGMTWLFASLLCGSVVALAWWFVTEESEKDRWGSKTQISAGNWLVPAGGWTVTVLALSIIGYLGTHVPIGFAFPGIPIITSNTAAKNLAAMGNIEKVSYTIYPETDTDHLNLLPPEVALDKVGQNWTRGGTRFASLFHPGPLVIQDIHGTLQYVIEPRFNNRWAYEQVNEAAPVLFTINAEDPQAEPIAHGDYQMKYLTQIPARRLIGNWETIPTDREVTRYLYFNGFSEYHLVDPTLELDDNLQPYITVALMKPTYNYSAFRLEGMVTINAQTGEITRYEPNEVSQKAPWIDRVRPDDLIKQYVEWWCLYSDAPHWNPSQQNTCKIANEPTVVYTDADHPAWQIFIEARKKESAGSSMGVILCSTKHDDCKYYEFLGLPVGSRLDDKFEGESSKDITGGAQYDVRNIELHKIHGQPTFIGQYIKPEGSIDEAREGTLAGIVLAPATEFQTADISFGETREVAFNAYYRYLARGGGSAAAPTEERVEQTLEGIIFEVVPRGSEYWVFLQGVPNRVFVAEASVEHGFNLIPLSRLGDRVIVYFGETGDNVAYLNRFENPDALQRWQSTPVPK